MNSSVDHGPAFEENMSKIVMMTPSILNTPAPENEQSQHSSIPSHRTNNALDKSTSKPKKTIIRRKRKKSRAEKVSDVIDDRGSDLSGGDESPYYNLKPETVPFTDLKS